MATKGQAIKFVMADFVIGWRRRLRWFGVVEYMAIDKEGNGGKLKVVTEGAADVMKTYFYQVPPREVVYVVNEVIHIPDRAFELHDGNIIEMED